MFSGQSSKHEILSGRAPTVRPPTPGPNRVLLITGVYPVIASVGPWKEIAMPIPLMPALLEVTRGFHVPLRCIESPLVTTTALTRECSQPFQA